MKIIILISLFFLLGCLSGYFIRPKTFKENIAKDELLVEFKMKKSVSENSWFSKKSSMFLEDEYGQVYQLWQIQPNVNIFAVFKMYRDSAGIKNTLNYKSQNLNSSQICSK